jgi:hypothetical protein
LFRWELDDLAREQLTGMPPQVQLALSDFMDAVVIVDPAEYQRRKGTPGHGHGTGSALAPVAGPGCSELV